MRVAFTSTDGKAIDEHFGQATHFHLYEIVADKAEFLGIVGAFGGQGKTHGHGPDHVPGLGLGAGGPGGPSYPRPPQQDTDEDDRIKARADAIEGCTLVYTVQIGGPAAAKLVARRIHPMKTGAEVPIEAAVAKLQEVLRGKPPPWLRKAMGLPPEPASREEDDDA
jgi:nitrogen fixation protein NifX